MIIYYPTLNECNKDEVIHSTAVIICSNCHGIYGTFEWDFISFIIHESLVKSLILMSLMVKAGENFHRRVTCRHIHLRY